MDLVPIFNEDIVSKAFNSCPSFLVNNSIKLNDVRHRVDLNPFCRYDNEHISQNYGVNARCVRTNLIDELSESLSNADPKIQRIIGLKITDGQENIKKNIEEKLKNYCKNISSTIEASVGDTDIYSCKWYALQDATNRDSCEINLLQKMATWEMQKKSKEKNKSKIFLIVISITFCLIIFVLLIHYEISKL
uniref:Uncharacterized protein n=1 Tax=viral metagenome TaxID=1070528 RepID=A0A6C0LS41_9ZZZZ